MLKNQWFYSKMQKREKKNVCFTVKTIKKSKHQYKTNAFFEKKGRKTNFGLRIRAVDFQYSSG